MKLKTVFYLLFILLAFTTCKTTSTIITSKSEAKKKGIYSPLSNHTPKVAKSNNSHPNKHSKKDLLRDVETKNHYTINTDDTSYLVKQLINTAMEYSGVRYRFGGTTHSGIDCSGLIFTTFNSFGIKIPRTSIDLSRTGTKLNNSEIKKGDLVFFRTNPRIKQINHVGLVVEVHNDEIQFIHASVQRGVIVSSTKEPYYKNSFVQANRVLD